MKRSSATTSPRLRVPGGLFTVIALAAATTAQAADKDPVIYQDLVAHVVAARCVSCHGEEKQKGKLRLDSLEEILAGSDGENVIPGDPIASLFIDRITLPADDDDHMPPEDKAQLTANEIKLLEWWVTSGAKGDLTVAASKPTPEIAAALKDVLANLPEAEAESDAPAVDPAVLAERKKAADEVIGRVDETGATLMAIAQDTPDLRFSALNVAKDFTDEQLALLAPVAEQILWMDLARTQVSDKGLAAIGAMKNLTRLHLENTTIGDAGIEHLSGLSQLEYLNLYGTQISDAGLAKLAGLANLKKIFVWQSKVSDKGVEALAAKLPDAEINNGWKADATSVEVAAAKPADAAAAPKPEAAKPDPKKPATPPAKPVPTKPETKPAAAPTPAPKPSTPPVNPATKKPETKPTPAPAPAPTPAPKKATTPAKPVEKATPSAAPATPVTPVQTALAEAEKAAASAKKAAAEASASAKQAQQFSAETQKVLEELRKAAAAEAKK